MGTIASERNSTAVEFELEVRRRNNREWLGAGFVAIGFAIIAFFSVSLAQRLTALLVVASALFVAACIYMFGRPAIPAEVAKDDHDAYRSELLRQAKLLRAAPVWYVAPLAGSILVFAAVRRDLITIIVAIVLGAVVAAMNLRVAQHLQRRADL
jgi:hypothetical protein